MKIDVRFCQNSPKFKMSSAAFVAANDILNSKKNAKFTLYTELFNGNAYDETLTRQDIVFGVEPDNDVYQGGEFIPLVQWHEGNEVEQSHVMIDMERARKSSAQNWIVRYVLEVIWAAGWDVPHTPGFDLADAVLAFARQYIEGKYPNESVQLQSAFANAVQTAVTGISGGYGGPSIREHAAGRTLIQKSLRQAIEAFEQEDGPVLGQLTDRHRNLAQFMGHFDDDQWDELLLGCELGLPTKIEVVTGNEPEDYPQIWVWGSVAHPSAISVMYNEMVENPKDALLLDDGWGITLLIPNEEVEEQATSLLQQHGWKTCDEMSQVHAMSSGTNLKKRGDEYIIPFEELSQVIWLIRKVFISQFGAKNVSIVK